MVNRGGLRVYADSPAYSVPLYLRKAVVLNANTVDEACMRLKEDSFPKGINALIFLLHKPIGLGRRENMIRQDDSKFFTFLSYVTSHDFPFKIGFDSCSIPALLQSPGNIDFDSLDTCEGARWSAYITPDMYLLPCSFDNQDRRWAVDLRSTSIQGAWESACFEDFRNHFRYSCPDCDKRAACLGGCPICPSIVLCSSHFRCSSACA